jgi:putative SOS response-associated peptidase YedK
MCGRYELHASPAAIALAFGLAHSPDIHPRYNVAPMTDVPIVRVNHEGKRELVRMRWGLVPRWAKDPSIGNRLINARGETIADKPSFTMPFRRHRCLLPADGFYEWAATASSGRKQPLHIGMKDGAVFGMGGLYERWLSPEGEVLDTCTIITTPANELVAPAHDRMPMIVAPDDFGRWLDPAHADVGDLIVPYPSEAMASYPISPRVNNVRHDDAALIEPAEPMPPDAEPEHPPPHVPEQEELF